MAPLQTAYLDVPLTGTKQSNEPTTAPLDGAYLLENYLIERTGGARKRYGFANAVTPPAPVSRLYRQSGDTLRFELPDGMYRIRSGSSTTDAVVGLGVAGGLGGLPVQPSPPTRTLVQQSVPTSEAVDCSTHVVRTANYLAVVTQEFIVRPTLKIAVYDGVTGAVLLPAAPFGITVTLADAPLQVSAVAGSGDEFVVAYSDGNLTTLAGFRVGAGVGGLALLPTHTTNTPTLQDLCRGPGGTCVVVSLSGVNAVFSLRRVSDGVEVATLSLPAHSGTASKAALNVGQNLTRASAAVAGTLGASTIRAYLLTLTPTSLAVFASAAAPIDYPTSTTKIATLVVNDSAPFGQGTGHLVFVETGASPLGASTGPVIFATEIQANGVVVTTTRYGGVRLAAKGWSPFPGQTAQPLTILDYRAVGSAAATSVTAEYQTYGYGIAVVDVLAETGGLASTRPLWHVRSWHCPGRGVRLSFAALLANYAFREGTPSEGTTTCLTAYDRASETTVESIRAVVVRTPPVSGSQPAATRLTPSTAEVSQASTLLAGGVLSVLHGADTRVAGDLHPADVLSLTQFPGSGSWGGVSLSVRARYSWLDASGAELTSAWSLPAQIAVGGSVAAVDVEVRIPHFLPPNCATRPHLQLAAALGTSKVFTKALIEPLPGTDLTASVPALAEGVDLLVQKVRVTPAGITSAAIDTGTLANGCPPPPRYVSVGRQRAWLVSSEDDRVYFSKPATKNVLPEWALELALEPPQTIGKPVAVEELGDKVLVLGAAGACYFLGDGPDANGDGAPYAGPYEALSGLGCDSVESVLPTPIGVFYRSAHTIVLISESLQATPLGREVFDVLAGAPFTLRAQYHERSNTALWLLSDAFSARTILTLNLSTMGWSTWRTDEEEILLQDLVVGSRIYASATFTGAGAVLIYADQEGGNGADGVIAVFGRLVTPFIRLEQVQRFQRLWNVQCLVDVKAAGASLSLTIYRDGKPTGVPIATKTFAAAGVQPVNFHVPANLQRCSSVRLEFTDNPGLPVVGLGGVCGVDLLGITLEIGVKRGLRGVPAAQRALISYRRKVIAMPQGLMDEGYGSGGSGGTSNTGGNFVNGLGNYFGIGRPTTIGRFDGPQANRNDYFLGGSQEGFQGLVDDSNDRAAGYAARTVNFDPSRANANLDASENLRGNEQALTALLEKQARGDGPSVAELQYQKTSGDATRKAASAATSARGGQGLLGARRAAEIAYEGGQDAASGAAQIRQQEMAAARGQLGSFLAQRNANELGRAGAGLDVSRTGTEFDQRQLSINDAAEQAERGRGLQMQTANQGGLMGYNSQQSSNDLATNQLNLDVDKTNLGQINAQNAKRGGLFKKVIGKFGVDF